MLSDAMADLHEIRPKLWLGSFSAANDPDVCHSRGITHVLSIALGVESLPGFRDWLARLPSTALGSGVSSRRTFDPTASDPFMRLLIAEDDNPAADVKQHFEAASSFIATALAAGGAVLVHCMAGCSRSATLVTAHIMRTERLCASVALQSVGKARPIVDPNQGFREQLRDLETDLGLAPAIERAPREWHVETRAERLDAIERKISDIEYVLSEVSAASDPAEKGEQASRICAKLCMIEAQLDAVYVTGTEELGRRRRALRKRCMKLMRDGEAEPEAKAASCSSMAAPGEPGAMSESESGRRPPSAMAEAVEVV